MSAPLALMNLFAPRPAARWSETCIPPIILQKILKTARGWPRSQREYLGQDDGQAVVKGAKP